MVTLTISAKASVKFLTKVRHCGINVHRFRYLGTSEYGCKHEGSFNPCRVFACCGVYGVARHFAGQLLVGAGCGQSLQVVRKDHGLLFRRQSGCGDHSCPGRGWQPGAFRRPGRPGTRRCIDRSHVRRAERPKCRSGGRQLCQPADRAPGSGDGFIASRIRIRSGIDLFASTAVFPAHLAGHICAATLADDTLFDGRGTTACAIRVADVANVTRTPIADF